MKAHEFEIFRALLSDVYAKATGGATLPVPLPENDAKTLTELLEEATGRAISDKTLRTYVRQAFGAGEQEPSSPSPFHLETLAQYALGLPGNTDSEGTPSWFKYRQVWSARPTARQVQSPALATETTAPVLRPVRRLWFWLSILVLPAAGWLAWENFHPAPARPFTEDFNRTGRDVLEMKGWVLQDYQQAWFDRQLGKDSVLTLWTLPGDYWVKKGEPRKIANMLVRKVEGNCFSVAVKIIHFSAYQNNQQLGVFLFDKDLNRETCVRFSLEFLQPPQTKKGHLQTTIVCQERGEVVSINSFLVQPDADTAPIWLRLDVLQNQVEFSQKINFDWNPWSKLPLTRMVHFKPVWVGMAAFQGWTMDDGKPKGADTIPVFIDEFRFQLCVGNQ